MGALLLAIEAVLFASDFFGLLGLEARNCVRAPKRTVSKQSVSKKGPTVSNELLPPKNVVHVIMWIRFRVHTKGVVRQRAF